MSLETSEGLLEAMGTQALASGSYLSPEAISKNIDNISLTDVANVRLLVWSVRSWERSNASLRFAFNVGTFSFLFSLLPGRQEIRDW